MRQAGESLDMQNAVAEIKIRAERKAGELLKVMPKNEGQLKRGDIFPQSQPVTTATLEEIGLTKMQSSRFQAVASLPEEVFEQYIEDVKNADEDVEITTSAVLGLAQVHKNNGLKTCQSCAKMYDGEKFNGCPYCVAAAHGIKSPIDLNPDLLPKKDHYRTQFTGENEWYTPKEYIELARAAMRDDRFTLYCGNFWRVV